MGVSGVIYNDHTITALQNLGLDRAHALKVADKLHNRAHTQRLGQPLWILGSTHPLLWSGRAPLHLVRCMPGHPALNARLVLTRRSLSFFLQ